MAFTGITATEAQIDQKIGADAPAAFTDVMKTQSLLMAENWLNAEVEQNYSDDFGSLDVDVKSIVTQVTASLVAMDAINYDPQAFGSSRTAELKLDVLDQLVKSGVRTLKEKSKQKFMAGV